jgi:hypothetical protein
LVIPPGGDRHSRRRWAIGGKESRTRDERFGEEVRCPGKREGWRSSVSE